jgi:hypothetical protein
MNRNNGGNAARTAKVQELRRSGAAGKHGDSRLKRQKTRGAVKAKALSEYR